MDSSRRRFLQSTALTGLAAPALRAAGPNALPTRLLGRTGARVSLLAFGCGSRFLKYGDDEAVQALTHALDLGITYVDTAYGYGNGKSEERVGRAIKGRRQNLWLATKVTARKSDDALRTVEGSLKRLQVDHLDLIHVHSLTTADDLAQVEAKDGVLAALLKLRDQKVTRAVGITSHTDPLILKTALERHDFDCTQMALNAARAGMANGAGGFHMSPMEATFEALALPVATRKNMGVIAMKVFAQEGLSGKAPAEKLLRYSLSLPVSAAVVGMPTLSFIEQNVEIAGRFAPLPPAEMRTLSESLSEHHKAELDRFFADHVDA